MSIIRLGTPTRDCPTPLKHLYVSKAAAKIAIKRGRGINRTKLQAYRCRCGYWHVGHGR